MDPGLQVSRKNLREKCHGILKCDENSQLQKGLAGSTRKTLYGILKKREKISRNKGHLLKHLLKVNDVNNVRENFHSEINFLNHKQFLLTGLCDNVNRFKDEKKQNKIVLYYFFHFAAICIF